MNQTDFITTSKQQVKKLNRGTKEAEEAWRARYLFLLRQLEEWLNSLYNDEFVDKIDSLVDDERYLDEFE